MKNKNYFKMDYINNIMSSSVQLKETKMFHKNGNLFILKYYNEQKKLEGEFKRWTEDGVLEVQCNMKNGKFHGEYKEWWPNGKLRLRLYYKEGYADGEYNTWRQDGSIETQKDYKNGELHGHYKEWDKDYELTLHEYYIHGCKVDTYYKSKKTRGKKKTSS